MVCSAFASNYLYHFTHWKEIIHVYVYRKATKYILRARHFSRIQTKVDIGATNKRTYDLLPKRDKMLLIILTISYLVVCSFLVDAVPLGECLRYSQFGDINIGGIFSFYVSSQLPCQDGLAPRGVFMAESMRFAIEEINNNTDLLPNVTLGFDILDDGWSEDMALRNTLDLVNDHGLTNQVCLNQTEEGSTNSGIIGIIGTSRSATTIPSTRLAALFDIPMISYYASSVELTDKSQYPYFLRTVPPDGLQVGAIVDILELYNWNYIGIIHSIDSYGIHGARQLQTLVELREICVAFIAPVSDSATEKELQEVVRKFDEFPSAKTVVMFSSGKVANTVLEQMNKEGFVGEINWIGSDDWGYDLIEMGFEHLTTGAIFTRFYSTGVPQYEQYIKQLRFDDPFLSPWYKKYWSDKAKINNCTNMDLCSDMFLEEDFSAIYITLPVIDAVYVFAHGLHSLMAANCNNSQTCQGLPLSVEGGELLTHLRNVNFNARSGPFNFDENADPPGKYILRNWQVVNDEHRFIDVGLWDSAKDYDRLTLDQNKIRFSNGSNIIPKSTCRLECSLGSIVIPLEQKCCYGCQKCLPNNIVVNNTKCVECPYAHWPDSEFSSCNPITPINLKWIDPLILVITIVSIFGVVLCLVTVTGMWCYGDQPIIKACSRELSAINILGIILSCICTFILVLPPNISSCRAVDAIISMSFTLTYAPTLLKVNRIYRIFRAGKKSVRRPKMVGPREQLIIVAIVIIVQVSECFLLKRTVNVHFFLSFFFFSFLINLIL